MEDTVQVMASGLVIDRITRPLQLSGNTLTVAYRKRIWPVTDSCIHLDGTSEPPATPEDSHPDAWMQLVARLLPYPLPTDPGECAERLRTDFRDHLPDSTVRAISLLASLGHETEARELLVDFLEQIRHPERARRLVDLRLLFRGAYPSSPSTNLDQSEADPERPAAAHRAELDEDELLALNWQPEQESRIPTVDDVPLRTEARAIQENIGTHAMEEGGLIIRGLDEMPDEQDWELSAPVSEPSKRPTSVEDNLLLQRVMSLGSTALDVLRYFADNPGDRAAHVEQVLGYPLPVINSLLSGRLSQYLQRSPSGGWACKSWVPDALATLDSES